MTELPTESADSPVPADTGAVASRPGVPVWRVGKPDAFLAESTDVARSAVREITADDNIGPHVAARSEGVRTVTHLFECTMPGYVGWQWFATLARVSRSKDATVNEVGLLPTNDSVLAPPWVPWAERVRPEDAKADEQADAEVDPADGDTADDDTMVELVETGDDAGHPADADEAED